MAQANEISRLCEAVAPVSSSYCSDGHLLHTSVSSLKPCEHRVVNTQATLDQQTCSHIGNPISTGVFIALSHMTNSAAAHSSGLPVGNAGNAAFGQPRRNQKLGGGNQRSAHPNAPPRQPAPQSSAQPHKTVLPAQQSAIPRLVSLPVAPPNSDRQQSCFNCKQTDHFVANCPYNIGVGRRCYTCTGVGHLARDCPS